MYWARTRISCTGLRTIHCRISDQSEKLGKDKEAQETGSLKLSLKALATTLPKCFLQSSKRFKLRAHSIQNCSTPKQAGQEVEKIQLWISHSFLQPREIA